ncbi:imidazole glycerol phosphate synthase subunit HisH [Nitrosococcus oceani]|uniref:Imidazole glycerol phosphate synthase subunit HisH n=2 Tax=Nitrosococcus oceani TaxID=1229 RepID=HIS5_NITOC|nr:imidazole glycerol phosphate synthase subunit HisH [Nitrosococcus oceani]Q3J6Q3.1 RecName: Full=Imidazole glycerol phosphate synthase subunit HisH; AltName: Full=IGP synthase glutaminase subunit; AltName: Full=IGP synthase subunit HisH; AltName: Full=ImGP synthase subunit HisH; Short=IGPS subunit HisH [Nitrosococcus oceani ATCC 19707]KFI18060.1 imidazole glycerol phosphate synthase [Nitrosococcus oceani C-27]ABA59493.1 imidazole glycerol phosphate synthase subunit hisH [Nitrosococcus oceani A
MSSVAVIDYGMGNLRSVSKALEQVAGKVRIDVTSNPQRIRAADRVVFPGVGAIRDCMHELRRLNLDIVVAQCAADRPFLGICLGLQALLELSEENHGVPCLGILPGRVQRFDAVKADLKVPHMGWNQAHQVRAHPLWNAIPQNCRFYFVHSYYTVPDETSLVASRTDYSTSFASALARDNIFAVQFHPEKSHTFGLQLLANFLTWNGVS